MPNKENRKTTYPKTINTSEFESHWVPLSYGLVPHLSKKLSKFPCPNTIKETLTQGDKIIVELIKIMNIKKTPLLSVMKKGLKKYIYNL